MKKWFYISLILAILSCADPETRDFRILNEYVSDDLELQAIEEGQVYLLMPKHVCAFCHQEVARFFHEMPESCEKVKIITDDLDMFQDVPNVYADEEEFRLQSIDIGTAFHPVMVQVLIENEVAKTEITPKNIAEVESVVGSACGTQ